MAPFTDYKVGVAVRDWHVMGWDGRSDRPSSKLLANFFIHAGLPPAEPPAYAFWALTFCLARPCTLPPFFLGMLCGEFEMCLGMV